MTMPDGDDDWVDFTLPLAGLSTAEQLELSQEGGGGGGGGGGDWGANGDGQGACRRPEGGWQTLMMWSSSWISVYPWLVSQQPEPSWQQPFLERGGGRGMTVRRVQRCICNYVKPSYVTWPSEECRARWAYALQYYTILLYVGQTSPYII